MERLECLQNRVSELLYVANKVQDRHNASVFVSLEDFSAQKYYLYCSKESWQKSLQLLLEGKRFIELSKEEYMNLKDQRI